MLINVYTNYKWLNSIYAVTPVVANEYRSWGTALSIKHYINHSQRE
jgi:hypothetical protein